MVDLAAKSSLSGLLPINSGQLTLSEAAQACITSIQIRAGKASALAKAMMSEHRVALPEAGQVTAQNNARLLWFGADQYLLIGKAPAPRSLASHAAMTDQSDAWAVMHLTGMSAAEVLARHCPLDLRPDRFGIGQTARTLVAELPAVVTPVEQGFEIMVLQSLVRTAVHHLHDAMKSVSAQAKLV